MTEDQNRGLTDAQVKKQRELFGRNELTPEKKDSFFIKTFHIVTEPMFLLLLIAAVIYFVLGEPGDGAVMLIFVVGIIAIEVFQEWKTDRTLSALKELSAPRITVIRNGKETVVPSSELVPEDLMIIQEGVKIPADGQILRCSDLCVDESTLTGEAECVWKGVTDAASQQDSYWRRDFCYAGTLVIQGTALVRVIQTGAATEYGKIGRHVAEAPEEPTPLQRQTGALVKMSAVIATLLLVLVAVVTWFNLTDHPVRDRLIESILSGITLAMAMIPEEFPVILTVFLSMGAWRLAKKSSLVRRLPSVETLGAVSVLCVDKTGTITMNQMSVQELWASCGDKEELCEIMGLACETEAYDPMEKAMLSYCGRMGITTAHLFGGQMLTEYSFTNERKMMGHVWRHDGEVLIAAKGSPEQILAISRLTDNERAEAEKKIAELSGQGLRVIAVGMQKLPSAEEIPDEITKTSLTFCGLVGLLDPPREGVRRDIAVCRKAGIRVVMITGDSGTTAASIAGKVGMEHTGGIITGAELSRMTDKELRRAVRGVSIFSRVMPEHKMRIVKAFRENGEIVAMTGDGVNDAPALKYAHIGIAMGRRGSEVSREAADLILMDDNFSTIVDTIRDGRRIYDNVRKAVGYVFTIHIPIAFSSLFAPLLGIVPAGLLLLPLHVVLLELIIDPTCSIVLERQPAESDLMERRPRDPRAKLLTPRLMMKSVLQGLVVFAVSFGTYLTMLRMHPGDPMTARTMGLAIMILANIFLVQVISSDRDSAFRSVLRLARDRVLWMVQLGTLVLLGVAVYSPLHSFLKMAPLSGIQLLIVASLAAASVFWYELVKFCLRHRRKPFYNEQADALSRETEN